MMFTKDGAKDPRDRDPECIGPPCFGYMLKGSVYESRKCDKCCVMGECTDRTAQFVLTPTKNWWEKIIEYLTRRM